jgi:restriction system protein
MILSKNYFRIMLGRKSAHADECHQGGFIGGDWNMDFDLSRKLPDNWREFNRQFIPVFLAKHPEKSKVAAGLACGMLHTI